MMSPYGVEKKKGVGAGLDWQAANSSCACTTNCGGFVVMRDSATSCLAISAD